MMQDRKTIDEVEVLISYIRQKRKEFFVSKLSKIGIKTSSRGYILYTIYSDEGLVQDDISNTLSMDKAFVTRELNALSTMGLIYREKDTTDHRKNHIYLTDEGLEKGALVGEIIDRWNAKTFSDFSDSDIDGFIDTLRHVKRNIDKW